MAYQDFKEALMNLGILETLLSVLFAALIVSVIFRRFQLPVILGYLLVGALLGPHTLGFIPDADTIKDLAEFGIVFLMFTVGLEFSQAKLFALKKAVFFIGGLQVILSVVLITLLSLVFSLDLLAALAMGSIAAMSSTAIVVKQLDEQLELQSTHGLHAIGILLFQDLAVIPLIILIANLANTSSHSLIMIFFWATLKGIFAIFLITVIGRKILRPFFKVIAKTRALELFSLTVLLITLVSAWITNRLGLSYSLGAFLGGMMLSETEYRHQIEIEIRPFRDILLGLFFLSIGMLTDMASWYHVGWWIILLLSGLVIGKTLLITGISYIAGNPYSTAIRTGLVLGQGGEFGFALLTLALSQQLLSQATSQIILAALLISMAISPIIIRFNLKISQFFSFRLTRADDARLTEAIHIKTKPLNQHIIICGFGRVGQQIARILDKANVPYIGLDIDPELIKYAGYAGENVMYGDASHPGILSAAGINRAQAIVISFDKLKPAIRVLTLIRSNQTTIPILVRCKDQAELEELTKYKPTKIIAETFEESLTLSKYLLQSIKMSSNKISALLDKARSQDYDLLRRIFTSTLDLDQLEEGLLTEKIMPILLPDGAYAVGHYLKDFDFQAIGVEIIGVCRGKTKPIKPNSQIQLKAYDVILIYGSIAKIDDAERVLLEGTY